MLRYYERVNFLADVNIEGQPLCGDLLQVPSSLPLGSEHRVLALTELFI
jgi:hypothetical protein